MWYVGNLETGFVVNKPRGLTIDSVQYPRNIFALWSKDELAAIDILPYSETKVDTRYYNSGALTRTLVDGEVLGTYATHDKDVDQLKESMLDLVKARVASLQGAVDWHWSRASRGRKPVPVSVQEYSDTIYSLMDTKEEAIAALVTMGDVKLYQNTPMVETRLVKHTSEGGVETYGPETTSSHRLINQATNGWPSLEDDLSFVSLIEE